MSEEWKRWECPVCRETYEDPILTYSTTCGNGHMVILGHPARDQYDTWAELDNHFYSPEELEALSR